MIKKLFNVYGKPLLLACALMAVPYGLVYGASGGSKSPQDLDTTLAIGASTTKTPTVGNLIVTGNATAATLVVNTNATINATSTATGIEVNHGLGNGDVVNSETSGTGRLYWGNHTGASGDLLELFLNNVRQFEVDHNGNVTATGSVTATTYYGDGSHLTGISSTPGLGDVLKVDNSATESMTILGAFTVGDVNASTNNDVWIYGDYEGSFPATSALFWDASKKAFHGSTCYSDYCTEAKMGNYSVSFGTSYASGDYSVAMGSSTISGLGAVGLGYSNNISGNYSAALGGSNVITGLRSAAIGYNNTVSGDYAMSLGNNDAQATANYSTAMGYMTTASGIGSIAIGEGINSTTHRMVNSTASSFAVGFKSDVPTFTVGPAAGTTGTYGATAINGTLDVAGGYGSTGMSVAADGDLTTSGQVGIGTNSLSSYRLYTNATGTDYLAYFKQGGESGDNFTIDLANTINYNAAATIIDRGMAVGLAISGTNTLNDQAGIEEYWKGSGTGIYLSHSGSGNLAYFGSATGSVKIDNSATLKTGSFANAPYACGGTVEGFMAYNSTAHVYCYCNATAWKLFDGSSACGAW